MNLNFPHAAITVYCLRRHSRIRKIWSCVRLSETVLWVSKWMTPCAWHSASTWHAEVDKNQSLTKHISQHDSSSCDIGCITSWSHKRFWCRRSVARELGVNCLFVWSETLWCASEYSIINFEFSSDISGLMYRVHHDFLRSKKQLRRHVFKNAKCH